ncbi:MAG: radical SAM protein [Chloroflexota bacterium]
MSENQSLLDYLDRSIGALFHDAWRVTGGNPAQAAFFLKMLRWQEQAGRTRRKWEAEGVHVPPFLIASITHRCNLQCVGCYARAQHRRDEPELSPDKFRSVLGEASELGVGMVLIAGGEPLTRPELLSVCVEYPRLMFPLFTNGMLIDDQRVAFFRRHRNLMPVISIEGHAGETDGRRGAGVHQHALALARRLKSEGVAFGMSLTVTAANCSTVTDRSFINDLIDRGCRLFFFVEYVPVQEGTDALVLAAGQRLALRAAAADFRARLPGLFITFPGDEEEAGGCLAAGRGFVHISPAGRVEPCPFAPYSDASLTEMSLKDALQSNLLSAIRANHDQLRETRSGCALWERRDWVRTLLPGGGE